MNDTQDPTSVSLSQMPTSLDAMVDQYVRLRDKIKAVEDANKEKLAPAKQYLEELNAAMLAKLSELGLESGKTPYGTAYKITKKSATIADGEAFRAFVIENEQFDLVDWRANALAVSAYIDEHEGEQPSGVNYSTFTQAGVRRG